MFTATLIAAGALSRGDISSARDALAQAGAAPGAWDWLDEGGGGGLPLPGGLGTGARAQAGAAPDAWNWLDEGDAADLTFTGDSAAARAALEGLGPDIVVQPSVGRGKKLLVADMDSTMITVECIDELADYAGIKAEIAAV